VVTAPSLLLKFATLLPPVAPKPAVKSVLDAVVNRVANREKKPEKFAEPQLFHPELLLLA